MAPRKNWRKRTLGELAAGVRGIPQEVGEMLKNGANFLGSLLKGEKAIAVVTTPKGEVPPATPPSQPKKSHGKKRGHPKGTNPKK